MTNFEESLQWVLQRIKLSDEDRQTFNFDAMCIRNYLMDEMKKNNSEFKAAFNGLSLTGSYLDILRIDLPDEFQTHIKLKFPFNLEIRKCQQRLGWVFFLPDISNHNFIGRKGRLRRYAIQMWIRFVFLQTIGEGLLLNVNDRLYKVEYAKYGRGLGVAHTVSAKEMNGAGWTIWFDFVPVIEFLPSEWPYEDYEFNNEDQSWFAFPLGKRLCKGRERSNASTFMVCAPHYERQPLHDKKVNIQQSLRLLKALRDTNNFDTLTSYMLKSLYLQKFPKYHATFWDSPIGEILIHMMTVLKNSIHDWHWPFLLHTGQNAKDKIPDSDFIFDRRKIEKILQKLKYFHNRTNVNLNEVLSLFHTQN